MPPRPRCSMCLLNSLNPTARSARRLPRPWPGAPVPAWAPMWPSVRPAWRARAAARSRSPWAWCTSGWRPRRASRSGGLTWVRNSPATSSSAGPPRSPSTGFASPSYPGRTERSEPGSSRPSRTYSTGQRYQRPLPNRPALPEPGGGRVMFAVPERGPVEDLEPAGLVGSDRGEQQLGEFMLRCRGLCDALDLDRGRAIDALLDRNGVESPDAKNRVVQPAELAEMLARDRMSSRRRVGHRPGQRQAQPVGPVGATRHGRHVALGVFGHQLGPDFFGQNVAGELRKSPAQAQVPQLSLLDPGIVAKAEGGLNPPRFGFPGIVQHVDLGPDVA